MSKKYTPYYRGKRDRNLIKSIPFIHNRIKENLYIKYAKSPLLELSGGRGRDLYKYKNAEIKKIYFIDIDKDALNEAKKLYEQEYMSDFKVYFFKRNLRKPLKLKTDISFNTVSIQFAIHYFLGNESMINILFQNIDRYLNENGIFMATFLDGQKIFDILKNGDLIAKKQNKTQYSIIRMYNKSEKFEKYGQKIRVYFVSIGSHDEYLVNVDYLISIFKDRYEIVSNELFDIAKITDRKINKNEKKWIELNRQLILKKIKN